VAFGGDLAEGFEAALLDDDAEELYEDAPCGYLSARPDGTIVKVNRTLLRVTGYEPSELVDRRRFQELLAPGDRIFFETHISPMLQLQGFARELAVDLLVSSGARLPVLLNLVLTRDANGDAAFIRAAVFDATERRAYERELVAARDRAEMLEAKATALAQTLQSTLLPPGLPPVPGLDVGGAYRPSGDGSEVGGDFYDLFSTGGGQWAVVLGDVCGKGAEAAVLTALARHTIRAAAMHGVGPSAVLTDVRDAFLRYHPEKFCTALYVALEPSTDGVRVNIASGGHSLPILRRDDGRSEDLGRPGPLLGMLELDPSPETTAVLSPGDLLVLSTDGVSEARGTGDFFGEERLQATIDGLLDDDAQSIADGIVERALEFQGGTARDDMAVVVLRAR
jgi:sigma-B regulation protein RsbU (phosphoserine phosphatase)